MVSFVDRARKCKNTLRRCSAVDTLVETRGYNSSRIQLARFELILSPF